MTNYRDNEELHLALRKQQDGSRALEIRDAEGNSISRTTLGAQSDSPSFTGDPNAPTASQGDDDLSVATTHFVKRAIDAQHVVDNGTYAQIGSPTFVTFGDSITGNNGEGIYDSTYGTAADGYQNDFSWQNWAFMTLGWRLTWLKNAGVAGDTTTQMLARMATDVTAYKATYVTVMGGRNDLNASVSPAAIMANLATICSAVISAGGRPILCTVLPSTSDNTTAKIALREQLNASIIAYARTTRGVILCDWAHVWTDPTTGAPLASVTTDGTHPTRDGSSRLGAFLAGVLSPLIAGSRDLVAWDGDSRSLGKSPTLLGTTGTAGTGVTGSVATGWTINASSGSISPTVSKVARTDGAPGEWQQIANPGGNAQLQYTSYTTSKNVLWTPGVTKYYAECEFEADNDWSGITRFGMQSFIGGQSHSVYANISFASGSLGTGLIYPRSGVLRTPIRLLEGIATGIGIGIKFEGTTGTVRIGRPAIRIAP